MAQTTNVGEIAFEIIARTEGMVKGMKDAQAGLAAFGGIMAGVAASFTTFALDMGKQLASGVGEFVKASFESIDAGAKLADTLNTDIQALRGLQYTASLAGSDAETLNKALAKMTNQIGQGLAGNKSAAEAFDSLGLSIEKMATMDSVSQFNMVSDAISKLKTPAQQAQAAIDIFGKSAVELLPTLAMGSAALAESSKEFDNLNGSMSRLDAAQVELANDSISRLKTVLEGAANELAVNLAPFITAVSKRLIDMGFNGEGAAKAVSAGFEFVKGVMQDVATVTTWLMRAWLSFQLIFEVLEKIVVDWFMTIEQGFNFLSSTLKEWTDMDMGQSKFFTSWHQQTDMAIEDTMKGINELTNALDTDKPAQAIGKWFDDVKKESDEAAQTIVDTALKRAEMMRAAEGTIERTEDEKKEKAAKTEKIGFATQLDSSRVSASALQMAAKTQKVTDPQLETTNKTLAVIATNTAKTGTARTV